MSTTIPTDSITDNADADPCPEHGTCTCTTGTRCDECAAGLALLASFGDPYAVIASLP